jgi:hypothetical protein
MDVIKSISAMPDSRAFENADRVRFKNQGLADFENEIKKICTFPDVIRHSKSHIENVLFDRVMSLLHSILAIGVVD